MDIKFIVNELGLKKDTAANRIVANIANAAMLYGTGSISAYLRSDMAKIKLKKADLSGINWFILSYDGSVTPYTGDNRYPLRNKIMFETNDKSLRIELFDAKINTRYENHIVKTALVKRKGTVKESITSSDYMFDVSGSLIEDSQNEFPIIALDAFVNIFRTEDNMSVRNVLINQFGVTKVAMETYDINQKDSKYINAINFNLKLISDQDIDLQIIQEG